MKSRDFCYWLQGFFELSGDIEGIPPEKVQQIKNHLNMVFKHEIDPGFGNQQHQQDLTALHNPGISPGDEPIMRC